MLQLFFIYAILFIGTGLLARFTEKKWAETLFWITFWIGMIGVSIMIIIAFKNMFQ